MSKPLENSNNKDTFTVADRIRRNFLQIELSLLEAESQMLVAEQDAQRYGRLTGSDNKKRQQRAVLKSRVLRAYVANIQSIKKATISKLDLVLGKYTQGNKVVFWMYFIDRKPIEEIVTAVNRSRRQVDRIIAKLKEDLETNYPLAK